MDTPQESTNEFSPTLAEVRSVDLTPPSDLQQYWIDYRALNGLIFDHEQEDTNGDFKLRKMSVTEFADRIGVDRTTLYLWQNTIPSFWDRVNKRRTELAPQSRLAKFHEVWFLKAIAMKDWRVSEAWARNFDPNYRESRQKVEHELGGSVLDVLDRARGTFVDATKVIEGETVDAASSERQTT